MRTLCAIDGLKATLDDAYLELEGASMDAMKAVAEGVAEEYRGQVFKALGYRLSNTVRWEVYPGTGWSLNPAGYVWFKAPRIIHFFSAQRVVTPIGAAFAIPVNPVIKRGGIAMTPVEVEAHFDQELEPRKLRTGNLGLFLDLVQARSSRRGGFRKPTKGRLTQGRRAQKTLMFVLVRSLGSRKLIDLDGPAIRWAGRYGSFVEKSMGKRNV